jgi:hypothetical protein
MQHLPLERLTIKDGKIYELYNGKLSNPFMGVSQLQVAKKLAVKERDQRQCEFGFELSSPADPVWIEMFMEDLGGNFRRVSGRPDAAHLPARRP